jgi:ABC-2 type transport system ATP-binding protein
MAGVGTAAIVATELRKHFGATKAVDGISFEIRRGQIFSLLGPNGAGKTTTISMLSGLLEPDSGDALIAGHSIRREGQAARAAIGVVPQEVALYGDLSARENLVFWGRMYGLRGAGLQARVDEILAMIGLAGRQKERVDRYSGGMKRRVNIGVALLHRPQILYLDEPTAGIDPQSRRSILDSIKELNRQGMTVLYTTHYMEEAQELSHHIAIMDHGRIIAHGTHDELVRLIGEHSRIALSLNTKAPAVLDRWRQLSVVSQVLDEDGKVTILARDSNLALPQLFEVAAEAAVRITSLAVQEPDLEMVFLHLTGRALRDT